MIATTTITDEVLQWTIDWVNKVFYSKFPLYTITEVKIDATPTTAYTSWYNTITFNVAPTAGQVLTVTYEVISDITTKELRDTKNFGELIDSTYLMFGRDIDRTSTVYPVELLRRYINEEYISILDNYTSSERYKTVRFPAVNSSTISSVDSTTMTLSALPNLVSYSGYWFTEKSGFFSYSGVNWTTLENINWFNWDISTGEVYLGIRLPEEMQRPLEVKLNGVTMAYTDFSSFTVDYFGFWTKYTVYNGYLFITGSTFTDTDYIDIVYEPITYELINDTDIPKIPSIYVNLLSYKAGERMMRYREDTREEAFRLDYQELKYLFNKRVRNTTNSKVKRPKNLNFI